MSKLYAELALTKLAIFPPEIIAIIVQYYKNATLRMIAKRRELLNAFIRLSTLHVGINLDRLADDDMDIPILIYRRKEAKTIPPSLIGVFDDKAKYACHEWYLSMCMPVHESQHDPDEYIFKALTHRHDDAPQIDWVRQRQPPSDNPHFKKVPVYETKDGVRTRKLTSQSKELATNAANNIFSRLINYINEYNG